MLGLAQGQTSALMLLCFACVARAVLNRSTLSEAGSTSWSRSLRVALGIAGWLLKPQLAPFLLLALARAGCWRALAIAGAGDLITGGNYMYLRSKPVHDSLLNLMGPWPWYVAGGVALGLALLLVVAGLTRAFGGVPDPRGVR